MKYTDFRFELRLAADDPQVIVGQAPACHFERQGGMLMALHEHVFRT